LGQGLKEPFDEMFTKNDSYKEALRSALSLLPERCQVTFAATCAEQVYPYYQSVAFRSLQGDTKIVRRALDRVWDHILGRPMTKEEIVAYDQALDKLDFDDAHFEDMNSAFAATGCVSSALQASKGEPLKHSVAAGLAVTDTIYQSILQKKEEGAGFAYNNPAEVFVESLWTARHPLMVEELTKQTIILRYLHDHKELTQRDIALLQGRKEQRG
jgi:uncharacterized protein YjaG (DUF416 family)